MAPVITKSIDQAGHYITRENHSWGSELGTAVGPISFAFRSTAGDENADTFTQFSADQIVAAERALDLWSDVANVTFNRVGSGYSDNATILFGNYDEGDEDDGMSAYAHYAHPSAMAASNVAGDVWIDLSATSNSNVSLGARGFSTLLHEIGHAPGPPASGQLQRCARRRHHLRGQRRVHRGQPAVHGDELLRRRRDRSRSRKRVDDPCRELRSCMTSPPFSGSTAPLSRRAPVTPPTGSIPPRDANCSILTTAARRWCSPSGTRAAPTPSTSPATSRTRRSTSVPVSSRTWPTRTSPSPKASSSSMRGAATGAMRSRATPLSITSSAAPATTSFSARAARMSSTAAATTTSSLAGRTTTLLPATAATIGSMAETATTPSTRAMAQTSCSASAARMR